eukprot:jgi/Mesen1/4826/ME000243S03997
MVLFQASESTACLHRKSEEYDVEDAQLLMRVPEPSFQPASLSGRSKEILYEKGGPLYFVGGKGFNVLVTWRRFWGLQREDCELVDFHAAPAYVRCNEYILRYYRADWSLKHTLLSLFDIHNETVNIWTHLIGFIIFLWLTLDIALREWPPFMYKTEMQTGARVASVAPPNNDMPQVCNVQVDPAAEVLHKEVLPKWPFFVFLFGAMFCLLSSTASHLLHCLSHTASLMLWKLDYLGIAVMVATSFVPPVYYGFLCQPMWHMVYLGSTALLTGCTIGASLSHKFGAPKYRWLRASVFTCLGLSGVVPCVHKVMTMWGQPLVVPSTVLEVSMGAIYAGGALVYVLRVPERWHPGRFDIAGHSHQIMHVAVVLGALVHYHTGLLYLHWRQAHPCASHI